MGGLFHVLLIDNAGPDKRASLSNSGHGRGAEEFSCILPGPGIDHLPAPREDTEQDSKSRNAGESGHDVVDVCEERIESSRCGVHGSHHNTLACEEERKGKADLQLTPGVDGGRTERHGSDAVVRILQVAAEETWAHHAAFAVVVYARRVALLRIVGRGIAGASGAGKRFHVVDTFDQAVALDGYALFYCGEK